MTEERFELRNPRIDYSIQCEEISDNGKWITYGQIVEYLNCFLQEAKDNGHYHTETLELYKAVSNENEELKIKLTETLQKHYDYADTQAQKNIDNAIVYASYGLLRNTVRIIAKELGVDLE